MLDKPAGMLSVPGKSITDSVESRLQARYPGHLSVMLVHRLDQATSGLLIAAKNRHSHRGLQHQFERRLIDKEYIALVSGKIRPCSGTIDLPLRVDLLDRPRQCVCFKHGQVAKTNWSVVSRTGDTTRIRFKPVTGRTHQLRVHAAHQNGLDAPIVGDPLYSAGFNRGDADPTNDAGRNQRMMLHLSLIHI